ncbi:MAG TPA: CSLREA domain-containing protein [Rhodanobacteraceae bacterium]|nr:CSLREA domain-containing protein [Rhodanobacteraceae bacterium]
MTPRTIHSSHRSTVVLALVLASLGSAQATTITVNDVGDGENAADGKCTLREAIKAANTNTASGGAAGECAAGQAFPTVDAIHFAIPGAGLHTIALASQLPDISQVVTIDGYTQTGSSANTLPVGDNAVLLIEVSAALLPTFTDTFRIAASGTTVRGLVVSNTRNQAFSVGFSSPADNVVIEGNFIGTDSDGTAITAAANLNLIRLNGTGNRLGGTTPQARNVIAGGGGSSAGTVAAGGTGNLIQGNYIGVDATGTQPLQPATATNAIELGPVGQANATKIGGSESGAGNVILGTSLGITLGGGVHDTVIQGNYIGIDATGARRLGGNLGIATNNGPTGTIIGGSQPGAGNVISGNNTGIYLGDGAAGTIVKGNRIGTDASGTRPVSNHGSGIFLQTPSAGSIIGGPNPGEGNTIAFNCGQGIDMWPGYVGWAMLGNSIFSNAGLGISLNHNGTPVANDVGDLDTGSNNLQNHPVITAAPVAAGMVDLAGTLNSLPAKTYRVEFFSGLGCHPTGSGEGRNFLGARDLLTDVSGNASFGSGSAMFAIPNGHSVFTATATDPDGNTSEFSQCFGTPALLFHDDFEGGCAGYD